MRSKRAADGLRRMVRMIARRIPAELRRLRGAAMLEEMYESLCVEDVACPACKGSGWLDEERFEHCPVCCGFREVPEPLADWFAEQSMIGPEGEGGGTPTACAGAEPCNERLGRLAERPYRLHVPEVD